MRSISIFTGVLFAALLIPATAIAIEADLPAGDFISQVLDFVKSFGGLPTVAKISGLVLIIIASMKVSFIRSFVWDKLGSYKAVVAPVLGLIVGIISMSPITLPGLAAYLFAGAGAIILHELFDAIKVFPGIGPVYVTIIDFLSKLFGNGSAK